MSRTFLSKAGLAVGAVGLVLAGCEVYDPSLLPKPVAPGSVPDRPAPETDGSSIDPITFALRLPVLEQDQMSAWKSIGFDLDGLDTVDPSSGPVECTPPGGSIELDGFGGIDNTMGSTLMPLVRYAGDSQNLQADAVADQDAGRGTMLIEISGYDGDADDPRVRVVVAQSVAGTSAALDEVMFDPLGELVMVADGTSAPPPAWGGSDQFFVRSDSFGATGLDAPLVFDNNAFVANHELVIHLPDRASILFIAGSAVIDVRLIGGLAVAPLDQALEQMTGIVIGGRMTITDILSVGPAVGICPGSEFYSYFQSIVPSKADLVQIPGTGVGPTSECDALSIGVLFEEGHRVKDGPFQLVDPPPYSTSCP